MNVVRVAWTFGLSCLEFHLWELYGMGRIYYFFEFGTLFLLDKVTVTVIMDTA